MESTNDVLGQIKTIWGRFSGGQKIGVGAAVAAAFAGVLMATIWAGQPDYRNLGLELSAKEAGVAIGRLDEEGIDYKVMADGSTILIETSDLEQARRLLAKDGLSGAGAKEDGSGMFSSGNTINRRQQTWSNARNTEKRVSATLVNFDYIEFAHVHITPLRERYYKQGRRPAKASVQVKLRGTLSDHQIQSITHTVAQAVDGLNPDHVTIQDTHGIVLKQPNQGELQGMKKNLLKHQEAIEFAKANRAQQQLDFVFGPGKTHVTVDVEIDSTRSQTRQTKYNPKSGITRHKEKNEKSSTSPRRVPGGLPVGSRSPANGSGGGGDAVDKTVSVTETKDFDRTETELVKMGGAIKRLSAAVFIDESLSSHEESIRKTLAAAVGIDESRGDSIALHIAAIVGVPETNFEEERSAAESQATVFAYAEYGIFGLLGALFLFFSLRTIKKAKASLQDVLQSSLDEEEASRPKPKAPELENVVLKAVNENSALAGRSLKRWLYEPVASE
ncbi:MAG: flagellar M-ring protein FliF C-terminal domain-containing protein [Planctomycetota bacterium]